MNYNAFCSGEKNGCESIFGPILLSERNMVTDYIYNILEHENPLKSICHLFFKMRVITPVSFEFLNPRIFAFSGRHLSFCAVGFLPRSILEKTVCIFY